MHLYHLTLQGQTSINQAVHGSFTGASKQQEVCVARGTTLQLIFCDPKSGKIQTLCTQDVFGVIRSLYAFRLTGSNKDYVAVGSDSGRIAILEYKQERNLFERIHLETYGKTGCRRVVPGQYLAADPRGRAIMIGAAERQKVGLHLESRQAHKTYTLCQGMVGVDVGFENPTFACLEFDYEEIDNDPTGENLKKTQQHLTFYELDLGLNHVVRKYAEPLTDLGNHLIAVPGGQEGPSGVIVCCENYLVYKNLGDQPDIKCPIPRRRNDLDDADRTLMIVYVFKVTLETDEDLVTEMKIKYFDTVPVANAMCILKTGFLFVAAEFGDHQLYQIANLGDNDDEPEYSSRMELEEGDTFFFAPRSLQNLVPVDTIPSLCPLINTHIADLAREDAPQIYAMCGRGAGSKLKVLRNGLEVSEMAVSELPGNPNAVWTVKRNVDDKFDAHIVKKRRILDLSPLSRQLDVLLIGDDSMLQVYPDGIRHIRSDRRVNEWRAPGRRTIVKCALNRRQVAIGLSGGEIVYFELDMTGQLNEFTERRQLPGEILCMSMSEVPEGEIRSRFLTVGVSDSTVRVISLDPSDTLAPLSFQALPSPPESLLLLESSSEDGKGVSTIHLNIGLQNGCLLRTTVDSVTGDLMDTRTRFLGTRPVRLFRVRVLNKDAVLCTSSRSWLLYHYQNRFHLTPLSYPSLEFASSFASEQCAEGVVAITENTLRIIAVEKLGGAFNEVIHKLALTPRRMVVHPSANTIMMIETDHATYTEQMKNKKRNDMANDIESLATDEQELELAREIAEGMRNTKLDESVFGTVKGAPTRWASVVRLLNAKTGDIHSFFELPQDEAAKCMTLIQFHAQPDTLMVLVGCAISVRLRPYSHRGGCVYTFLLSNSGDKFDLVHRTPTEEPVTAVHDFRGMALIALGNRLRIYEFGKRKLLAKCENKVKLL
ncbi:unnamed protein product, partial [Mesorhabditis belari]|uniref:Splicing factor 3B subunit 3 n=1 Tax=Mesorhabditis belari TaxID=2138241 RepID=A0AAF3EVV3_9BILA